MTISKGNEHLLGSFVSLLGITFIIGFGRILQRLEPTIT
jgi:hypothetical protein